MLHKKFRELHVVLYESVSDGYPYIGIYFYLNFAIAVIIKANYIGDSDNNDWNYIN